MTAIKPRDWNKALGLLAASVLTQAFFHAGAQQVQNPPDASQPANAQLPTAAQQLGQRLGAQVHSTEGYGGDFIDGFWNPVYHEDSTERGTGPDQGDYAGLPITHEAALHAQTHDPEIMDIPENQCRPHPSIYGMRGAGGLVRIWQDLDPTTQQQNKIELRLRWQQQHRVIWMDGHPHPPDWAPHTWQGFSTGHWVGDVLEVHTDMLKGAYIRRNGLDTDDRATSDERFFRYGNLMVHIMMVSDPGVLTEPMVKSNNFLLYPNATMSPYPCQALTEIPRPAGEVPMHLPNQIKQTLEWAIKHKVPVEASLGGADTMLPAYQDYMRKLPPNPPLSSIEKLAASLAEQKP